MADRRAVKLRVAGWIDTSLVDVLGDVSFTVWFNYCNFRCPWCQNAHVVRAEVTKEVSVGELLDAISEALPLVGYVHATGGEPTLQPEGLEALFSGCKEELGVKTSLDTNSSRPDIIEELFERGLVDHFATDVKAPLGEPDKYGTVIGLPGRGEEFVEKVRRSIQIAIEKAPFIEVRTTLVPTLITNDDIIAIALELAEMGLKDRPRAFYVLQQFFPAGTLMDPSFASVERIPAEELVRLAEEVVDETGLEVYVRTQEMGVIKA